MTGPVQVVRDVGALHRVLRDARLPRAVLDALVRRRLQAVLVSAYRHVPYYRERMCAAGYDPVRAYRGPEDLRRIPITRRGDLNREDVDAIVRRGADLRRCHADTTSGSSGVPLRVYRGSRERAVQIAKWLRVLFANGYSTRDKVMALVPPARAREGRSVLQHFGFLRRRAVDYLESSPEEMVDLLLSYRPQVLYGNRAHLDLMALEIRRRGLPPPGLKLLIVGAEVVHDSSRRLYRDTFGIEPLEYYGSVEMGVMAYETPARDGLRLCEDLNCFEFLDDDGNPVASGEPGRVVVTDLTAQVMPFIRYDQGDLAVFREGATGDAGGRRLRRILGRDEDYIVLPDGTRRSFHVFYNALHDFPDVLQFRVVQETADRFQILLVTPPDRYAAVRDGLFVRLRQAFPPVVTFDVTRVERIEPDATGKIRRVVSKVARGGGRV